MGAQTLEILRTGVWASLTGGWFYDPHQNVFCNTFHFYLWIFLLCFPFTIYLSVEQHNNENFRHHKHCSSYCTTCRSYFPATRVVYCFYCGTVASVFLILKFVNHSLHRMFDTSPCIHETVPEEELPESQRKRAVTLPSTKAILEEEGIELQVLKPTDGVASCSIHDPTDDDSLNSVETAARPISSTIDLKVDVHRKNSSGSSEEARASGECPIVSDNVKDEDAVSGTAAKSNESPVSDSAISQVIGEKELPLVESEKGRCKGKEARRRSRCALTWNRSIECDSEQVELGNGSCGVLPRVPAGPDLLKNTGSLELPIKDNDVTPNSEKGLLYWKQQNFEPSCCEKLRKVENVQLPLCSETSIASTSSINQTQKVEDLNADVESIIPGDSMSREEAEAKKFLEEEFEWYAGEYSEHLPSSSDSRLPKFKSDDNIRENQTMPCLKFQANSDEDSSDNAGSRSPLLCRHESLEKARYLYQDSGKSMRNSSEEKTTKSCPTVTKTPLTVYYDDIKSAPDDLTRWNNGRKKSSRRESFLHGNTKLSLPQRSSAEDADEAPFTPLSREKRTDLTWSSERVGLDWLFEHTDSETEIQSGKGVDATCASSSAARPASPLPPQNLGAIPKAHVVKRNHRGHRGRSKRNGQSAELVDQDRREKKKQKNERENGIIDEEEIEPSSGWGENGRVDDEGNTKPADWRETYDSSSGSATELSSLLPLSSLLSSLHPPSSPLLAAFLASRRELPGALQMPGIDDGTCSFTTPQCAPPRLEGVRERHRRLKRDHCHRSSTSSRHSSRPVVAQTPVLGTNTHIATSYNDTSQGAVHCFQDERGNWWSYTFGDGLAGSSQPVPAEGPSRIRKAPGRKLSETWDSNINLVSNSNSENESSMSVSPRMPRIVMSIRRSSGNPSVSTNSSSVLLSIGDSNNNGGFDTQRSQLQLLTENMARGRSLPNSGIPSMDPEEISRFPIFPFLQAPSVTRKHYYKFFYTPCHFLKIRFDRLELIALLDRNLTLFENCLSLFLSVLVSICGILLLSYGFYRDLFAFILCVTIAGCHYSLLKSVQPDASSPTHGYNRVVIYSRAIYFCVTAVILLTLSAWLEDEHEPLVLYNMAVTAPYILRLLRDLLSSLLLLFPLLFTLGLFPQINTFTLYLLEQLDIHVFGGNASCSLIGATYCIARSVLSVFFIFGFAYGALCEEKQSQHILFSIFCALVVTWSYHLSRSSSDPTILWNIVKDEFREKPSQVNSGEDGTKDGEEIHREDEFVDPLPTKLKQTVHGRLINDVIVCGFVALLVFGIHCSAVFTTLQPDLNKIVWVICGCSGFLLHYIVPQLRKELPWLCLSRPILRSHEHGLFEVLDAARVMWFEETAVVLCFLERNIVYPVLALSTLTNDAPLLSKRFGTLPAALLTTVCGMKLLRSAFSHTPHQYLIVVFSALLFEMDFKSFSETFLMDYFFISIVFTKAYEFLLKVQFVVTYIAPWQITWGSAFHAFAQPFSVPHSAMLFVQAAISAVLSAPLNPFLGSAIFLVSYVRPVKFWERDYNTKRVDQSNIRLSSHLDRNLGADDNNLNSIFYEHLTRSLQHSLCGDLQLGRWGPVSQGDCFVLASDYLNCLVHIIEMGNGLVTFQMRGLEFRGTYCQQREVEAISEGVEENDGCCCCEPGHLPNVLSVNAAFSQRWLAWEVTATKYALEGYSISDNSAVSMLQVFDFRKVLVTYYVKGIIWYCVRSSRLEEWLSSRPILSALQAVSERNFVDLDPVFNVNIDQDFDFRAEGITRGSFCSVYLDWIQFCASKREKAVDKSRDSPLVSLCLALSLMARRVLGTASHNTVSSVEFFLYGLHTLFKGDFRITSVRDEWVFSDMDLLKKVVAPAVRMSLKLHQDHFMSPEEYEDKDALYTAITSHDAHLVISHEADPAWRAAVLSGTPSLLALRHVMDDGSDEYKVIMLNKRFLSFRVIKLNRECVRGLWAGQQQELIFLRNRNPERGSIQNAKQALRNMINSSCDQPIGYPIYVSPLTTSYADTNEQLCSIIGGSLSLQGMRDTVLSIWERVRQRCRQGCSSGGSVARDDPNFAFGNEGVYAMTHINQHSGYGHSTSGSQSMDSSQIQLGGSNRGGSLGRSSLSGRGSFPTGGKPSSATLVSLAGLLSSAELTKGDGFLRERETSFTSIRERQGREDCCRRFEEKRSDRPDDRRERSDDKRDRSEEKERRRERRQDADDGKENSPQRVLISDPKQVFDAINLGRRIDVLWPDENMRARGGRSYWKDWLPDTGMEGLVVHKWIPNHRDPSRRSHVDKTILLLKVGERFVPIAETGVIDLPAESDLAAPLTYC